MRRSLSLPADFDFGSAVCSHGFFVLAPNLWDPAKRRFRTVVTLRDDLAVTVTIRELPSRRLSVHCEATLSLSESALVVRAVRRMLRLDEDLSPFHDLCRTLTSYNQAVAMRFGRLLRSGCLFEDIVKVICTCNVGWGQTVAMVERIVAHWGVPTSDGGGRGFPTPRRLVAVSSAELRQVARVGYRAAFIHDLARAVADGLLDLEAIEHFEGLPEDRYRQLRAIRGVGDYAASHLCMLLGDYSRLAVDTEMIRLLRQRYPRKRLTPIAISQLYRRWHPYQYLAYWYDLWSDYTKRHGRADLWSPAEVGRRITKTNEDPAH